VGREPQRSAEIARAYQWLNLGTVSGTTVFGTTRRYPIQSPLDDAEKLEWQEDAACRTYDNLLFFGPDQGESELERQAREARAKAVCQRCPVAEPCLEFAMETNQKYGIWGGLTDKERASRKRRRARARRAS
jgi:WhiB family transcriptional regulator, redox-sensing transcriptional regulator